MCCFYHICGVSSIIITYFYSFFLTICRHHAGVLSVAQGKKHLVTSSTDGCLKFWNQKTMAPPAQHQHPVCAVAVSPDGALAVSGDRGGFLAVWDLAPATSAATLSALFHAHAGAVTGIQFMDNHTVVTVSQDCFARCYELVCPV
jgi:WD40 repeat protein